MSEERWLPAVGFEGFYEVSDQGRVRSVDRLIRYRNGQEHFHPGRMMSIQRNIRNRYAACSLQTAGRIKMSYVHRLVLAAFVGPCPDGMEACHNDGDRSNNTLDNLRWDTPKNNQADRDAHGTKYITGSKLSSDDATEIRRLYAAGIVQRKIAELFSTTQSNVSVICKGRTWNHTSPQETA